MTKKQGTRCRSVKYCKYIVFCLYCVAASCMIEYILPIHKLFDSPDRIVLIIQPWTKVPSS